MAVVAAPELAAALVDGDRVSVDLAAGAGEAHGREYRFDPLGPELLGILAGGGLWASRAAEAGA